MGRKFACAWLLAAAVIAPGCSRVQEVSERGHPLGDLEVRSGEAAVLELVVEIADTPEARQTGLMGVRELSDDAGMAFLFDAPSQSPFFMKNTLIPLDIAFWDTSGRIVDILEMQPCRAEPCTLYYPGAAYVGAVEVNQGLLAREGVRIGHTVTLQRR